MMKKDALERRRVGLLFDERMCKHKQPNQPENPDRIRAIWDNLTASALLQRCVVVNAKEAEDDHLALVHSKKHIDLIKTISSKNLKAMRKCANRYDSIYFNKGSSEAAYLAAGYVIEATEQVAKGEVDSAFAIVRPPGHHAEETEPMGFCLFNNVAVATSFVLNERPELGIKKILIVDWDVHHGNSTQKMFYRDPRVLVFSVHRHDFGRFYPEGNEGSYKMMGEGLGAGYNINVPWESGGVGDADYFAVWDHILIPVAREFNPDIIIISAGFDAGDPVGGCCLTPYGYSLMLYKLLEFASGKIVMALEGGYNPVSLAKSTQACVEILLYNKPPVGSLEALPLKTTWRLIQAVRQASCVYWPILDSKIADKREMLNVPRVLQCRTNDVNLPLFVKGFQDLCTCIAEDVSPSISRLDNNVDSRQTTLAKTMQTQVKSTINGTFGKDLQKILKECLKELLHEQRVENVEHCKKMFEVPNLEFAKQCDDMLKQMRKHEKKRREKFRRMVEDKMHLVELRQKEVEASLCEVNTLKAELKDILKEIKRTPAGSFEETSKVLKQEQSNVSNQFKMSFTDTLTQHIDNTKKGNVSDRLDLIELVVAEQPTTSAPEMVERDEYAAKRQRDVEHLKRRKRIKKADEPIKCLPIYVYIDDFCPEELKGEWDQAKKQFLVEYYIIREYVDVPVGGCFTDWMHDHPKYSKLWVELVQIAADELYNIMPPEPMLFDAPMNDETGRPDWLFINDVLSRCIRDGNYTSKEDKEGAYQLTDGKM